MKQIPLDLEQTAESCNNIAISFKPGQEARWEAEALRGLGFSAWFDQYRLKSVKPVDAVSNAAVGQKLDQGWFAGYQPIRIIYL